MQKSHPETEYPAALSREKIKFPILAPLFAAVLLLLFIFILAIYHLQQLHITNEVDTRLESTRRLFKEQLATDACLLDVITCFIKNDPNIQNIWLTKDRDALLSYTTPLFENFRRDYRVTHFYFIDTDSTCFLRVHNPPRFGDRIDRFTLLAASRSQKPFWGIELGPLGTFTLRMVHPWFVNGKLVGYIELGEEIEHIAPRLKETLDVELVFLINKSFLKRDGWEEGLKVMGRSGNWDLIADRVVADSTIPVIPPEFIKFMELPHSRHEDCFVSGKFNGSTYLAGCVRLLDAAGHNVGDVLVIKNISKDEASLRTLLAVIASICFFVGALLVSFFYFHITGIEKHIIKARSALVTEIEKRKSAESELRRNRDNLEKIVESRTAELGETNKCLRDEIAERKQIEVALRNSEQRFKQVAESAGDWIWEVDTDGLYTYASPVVEKVLGYKPQEIAGKKHFYDLFAPQVKEAFKKNAFEVFNKKESFAEFINPVIHKNGSTVVLETTGTPILDDRGNLLGYRGADRDVTERNKAQRRQVELLEQLEKTNKRLLEENEQRTRAEKSLEKLNTDLEATVTQLRQSNRQLREFAHLASHDLRTPLRGIGILAQWLAQDYYDKFDDEGHRQIDLLVKRVERMDKLMDAILQYSTIARNPRSESHIDLNASVTSVLAELCPSQNIKITVNNTLPALICEEEHITLVFHNLLDNAIKFMDKPEGHIIIGCAEEEHFWKFSVSDNGPGIQPQHFERIFKLFQTLDDRDRVEGTGVGLPLVQKAIELYGGRIWLTSKIGEGSTFFFTLPKQTTAVAQQTLQPAAT